MTKPKHLRSALLGLSAALLLSTLNAAEAAPVRACVKYQRADQTWSKEYKATGEIDRWNFVIRWKKGEPTVIPLERRTAVPDTETSFRDVKGRHWIVRSGWYGCGR